MSSISPFLQGGGFPFSTGFGPTSTPGGFSNQSFGAPGVTGFGFPPPFVDPFFFFTPAASSFNINRLLGAAAGISVPINIGPTPSTLGISPLLLGFPFFGGGSGGNGLQGFGSSFGTSGFSQAPQQSFGSFGQVPQQSFGAPVNFGGGFMQAPVNFGGSQQLGPWSNFGGFNGLF